MTNQQHPITPSPELRAHWRNNTPTNRDCGSLREGWIMDCAAQWGANQELEACRDWVSFYYGPGQAERLRIARRPKPPSEADQALETLNFIESEASYDKPMFDTIRRALERLKKLEQLND